nr:reverse transcriptase domain-containing protein [Tanacetum cinerariifolium]
MAENFHREKEKSEKLKKLKARLNFESCSETSRSLRQRVKEGGVFKRLGSRGKSLFAHLDNYNQHSHSRYTEALSESEDSEGGHWKSRSKKNKSSGEEDDLSQPWVCEETDTVTPRIRYFDFLKTRMPSHIKTYDGSKDPEDHLKVIQAAAKTERWAMPTWCHMFNSTLTGNARVWFDDLPPESVGSYDDLKKAFSEIYLQQKKYIKDLIELHNIKQRNGEFTKDFVRRYKLQNRDVKRAPECMRISRFMHGITNPELIKRHNTDECMHLKKQIEEMLKAGKLSHLIKEIKQNNEKEQPKVTKKKETSGKDKALAILMVQPWERVARQRITQSFSPNPEIFFPPLGEDEGTEGPMIIEAEIGAHYVHRIVPRHITEHRLNVREECSPVRKKKRGQGADRNQAIQKEFGKLIEAGIMRELIAELPMLTTPMEKEELIVYLAAAKETVSAVLMTKREAKQMPVYFVSRALRGPELNYTSIEKLVLALVDASKRLKRTRLLVKGHILADFIVERPEEDSPDTPMEEEGELPKPWILFTDESSCTDGSGSGLILTNLKGMEFTYAQRLRHSQSNKSPAARTKKTDALSKIASTSFAHLSKQVLVKELKEKSISEVEILAVVEEDGDTWMTPLFKYLAEAHRTMIKSSNGDTPFSLMYGMEVVILVEIGMPTLRTVEVDQVGNNEALEINLDLLEERREEAAIREAKSKVKIEKYYNSKVRNTRFKPKDLVYRNNDAS